jgi:predicted helicase
MKTIHQVLDEYRNLAFDERHKGSLFEDLIERWLQADSFYGSYFKSVTTYAEWAKSNGKLGNDTGIDLVAIDHSDGTWAIQCKFYDKNATIEKKDIDSFFTASGKKPFVGRIIFTTTDHWSKNAEEALEDQQIPVIRLRVQDLDQSNVSWDGFSFNKPSALKQKPKKKLREHQVEAFNAVATYFENYERGKLVMACGTGKTLTSLRIAESHIGKQGTILYLVPSISLLSQTLTEWVNETELDVDFYAVCSDVKVGKRQNEDIQVFDLNYPATTDSAKLLKNLKERNKKKATIIFSTYQSISVLSEAQKNGLPEFDMIICDEAHRTTGVTLAGESESHFVRVHDNTFIKAKKRLYMTATPRIYSDAVSKKADEINAVAISMDNESYYGKEVYRLNFGEAVQRGLLTDYKVIILTVAEEAINKQIQKLLTFNSEINLDDASKIVGCINGLLKHGNDANEFSTDPSRMKTAVAFARSIAESQRITNMFAEVAEAMSASDSTFSDANILMEHVDGTFNILRRNEKLDWLKEATSENETRILSNAKCLSEGIDVPALDAVLFLNPRESLVDIVQSVGRVMRKTDDKKYGYVILPVTLPSGKKPEDVLNDNKSFRVVWQVLQALRSHDESFDAMVNKINLNGGTDSKINIIGVGMGGDSGGDDTGLSGGKPSGGQLTLDFDISEWKDAILAKLVSKVGKPKYWEDWAKDVADIARRSIVRITELVENGDPATQKEFSKFLKGLQDNLNPSVTKVEAIEMLAQHMITKPIFEALFDKYNFTELNPVSKVMQGMVKKLNKANLDSETESLDPFYESVRARAAGVSTQEGRQHIVKELYEKFFRFAFSGTAERLGIVYTPLEIVDFILHSTQWALKNSFGQELKDNNVHILDPFTGTGTFVVRLLQSGLIPTKDLKRKFTSELHANELVLLAYYVAAINIEETFFSLTGEYEPFDGIVLTDTFQMTEGKDSLDIGGVFPDNNERVKAQNNLDIRVILGNPPYAVGNMDGNNIEGGFGYSDLDASIDNTYAKNSSVSLKKSLYDSYFRAFRWSSDRIGDQGIICFVTNGSWIDSNTADGFRKSLASEFSDIYVFNLRGNQRTQGEVSRREGGKVFGSGSRTPIAITLLVRNPESKKMGNLHYYDIGDYLSREEKLEKISLFASFENVPSETIMPDQFADWVNQRREDFQDFIAMGEKDDKTPSTKAIFSSFSNGVKTNRDSWAYNFDPKALTRNVKLMIETYNSQIGENSVVTDPKLISWDQTLLGDLKKKKIGKFDASSIRKATYRPFVNTNLYFSRMFNNSVYQIPRYFPEPNSENLIIGINQMGTKSFDAFITRNIPDVQLNGNGQYFPLYIYKDKETGESLFEEEENRRFAISKSALLQFHERYGKKITEEEVFFYVYGMLWNPDYLNTYSSNLRKELPRIPFSRNFVEISKLGKELAYLHLDFETCEEYELKISTTKSIDMDNMSITKMSWDRKAENLTLVINGEVRVEGFPSGLSDLLINGRNPVDWIVDRFQVKNDPDSGIRNDPNPEIERMGGILATLKRLSYVVDKSLDVISKMPPVEKLE